MSKQRKRVVLALAIVALVAIVCFILWKRQGFSDSATQGRSQTVTSVGAKSPPAAAPLPKSTAAIPAPPVPVPPAGGSTVPALDDIVMRVKQATAPSIPYKVVVTQTTIANQTATTTVPLGTGTFEMRYDPVSGKFISQNSPATQPGAGGTPAASASNPPDVRIAINLTSFLGSLAGTQDVSVTSVQASGKAYYRVAGNQEQVGFVLLVDPENWFISHATVDFAGRRFAEVAVEYKRVAGYWMSAKMTTTYPSDGSVLTHIFADYVAGNHSTP